MKVQIDGKEYNAKACFCSRINEDCDCCGTSIRKFREKIMNMRIDRAAKLLSKRGMKLKIGIKDKFTDKTEMIDCSRIEEGKEKK